MHLVLPEEDIAGVVWSSPNAMTACWMQGCWDAGMLQVLVDHAPEKDVLRAVGTAGSGEVEVGRESGFTCVVAPR